jgi:hypothetical protein
MRRSLIVAAIAALLLVWSMDPVGATPPTDVQFGGESIFALGGGGPFASVEGICGGGNQVDLFVKIVGFQSGTGKANVPVLKEFARSDWSGTFLVKLQIREDPRKFEGGTYSTGPSFEAPATTRSSTAPVKASACAQNVRLVTVTISAFGTPTPAKPTERPRETA